MPRDNPFIAECEAVCVVENLKTMKDELLVSVNLIPFYEGETITLLSILPLSE